jgi:methylmalonyl-CoA mutase cobalamin-binding subunit
MTQAVLSLHGSKPVQLGQQVPFNDLVGAVMRYRADIVGLSFSHCYAPRLGKSLLVELRQALAPEVEIWAGGRAVSRFGKLPPGVHALSDLHKAVERLQVVQNRLAAGR